MGFLAKNGRSEPAGKNDCSQEQRRQKFLGERRRKMAQAGRYIRPDIVQEIGPKSLLYLGQKLTSCDGVAS